MEHDTILEPWNHQRLYDDVRGSLLINTDTKLSSITRMEIEFALKGMPMMNTWTR